MKRKITWDELGKHNKGDNLWLLIDGNIYDVSKYQQTHPGGDVILISRAGRDATRDFHDTGHSIGAKKKLEELQIGFLDKDSQGQDWQQTGYNGFDIEQFQFLIGAFLIVLLVILFLRFV